MKANDFVKNNGLWVFKYALAQLAFKPNMYLVVYADECDFVSEIKTNHGNCVFSYSDVKRLVKSHEVVESYGGLENSKKSYEFRPFEYCMDDLKKAIADVESCL